MRRVNREPLREFFQCHLLVTVTALGCYGRPTWVADRLARRRGRRGRQGPSIAMDFGLFVARVGGIMYALPVTIGVWLGKRREGAGSRSA